MYNDEYTNLKFLYFLVTACKDRFACVSNASYVI